jgi:hypothetical protein
MKYDTVEIIRDRFRNKWVTRCSADNEDRKRGCTTPMGLGFYHYPRYMGVQRAFDKLKSKLIKGHKDEITRLEKSLEYLEKLQLPKTRKNL